MRHPFHIIVIIKQHILSTGNLDGSIVSKENMNLLLQKLTTRPQQTAATISLQSASPFSSPQLCFEDLIKLEMSQEMKRQRDADELVTYKKNTRSLGKENSQKICDRLFISSILHCYYPSTLLISGPIIFSHLFFVTSSYLFGCTYIMFSNNVFRHNMYHTLYQINCLPFFMCFKECFPLFLSTSNYMNHTHSFIIHPFWLYCCH